MLLILLVSINRQGPCLGLYTRWGDVSLAEKLWEPGAGEETPDRDNSLGGTILLYLDKLSNTRP